MKSFYSSRVQSFRYAFSGLAYVLRTQKNAWIHLSATILVLVLGVLLGLSATQWALLAICITMVWITELVNTAVEILIDMISPDQHPLAKIVKDVSAAAVLLAAACSVIVGFFVFIPVLISVFSS